LDRVEQPASRHFAANCENDTLLTDAGNELRTGIQVIRWQAGGVAGDGQYFEWVLELVERAVGDSRGL
jgi:hypothetical protein